MAISVVQTITQKLTDAGGATTTLTFTTLPTAGNGIIVWYSDAVAANPITDPTMADNQGVGNSYSKATAGTDAGAGQMAAVWFCPVIGATSGTFTITITHAASTNNYSLVTASEISGPGGITLDTHPTAHQQGNTSPNALSTGTLGSSDEIICGCCTIDGSNASSNITCTIGGTAATNVMVSNDTTSHIGARGDYRIVASNASASVSYAMSTTGLTDSVVAVASFRPSASPPGNINLVNLSKYRPRRFAPASRR